MSQEAVLSWAQAVLAKTESVFGTAEDPIAASGLEVMTLDMGPAEVGNTRGKKDKTSSREMQLAFVEGRVEPIPFNLETSVKSRAAADTVPKESPLYKAAGLIETVNSSTSVVYSYTANPTITGLTVHSNLGVPNSLNTYAGEVGFGGLVKQITWSGGDTELMAKVSGAFVGKAAGGQAASGTLTDDTDTTLALGAGEAYRFYGGTPFAPFYVKCESEILKVTGIDYAGDILTVTRAALSSSAVAHSAQPVYFYAPVPTLAGSPISEANITVTFDAVATRCTKFSVDLMTGMEHRPGESGSKRIQGGYAKRIDVKPGIDFLLTKELFNVFGKANQRKTVALTIACGTGTGGIVTFSMPYCEVIGPPIAAPANDITIVSMKLRARGNSGNDALTITLT